MPTDHNGSDRGDSRMRVALSSRPTQLLAGVLLVVVLAWVSAGRVGVDQESLGGRVEGADSSTAAIPPLSDQLMVVITNDKADTSVVDHIEALSTKVHGIDGVVRVASPTESLVLMRKSALEFSAAPAFGSRSTMPTNASIRDRATLAASSVLGSGAVVSADGRTMAVIADLAPGLDASQRRAAAKAFTQAVDAELPASIPRFYTGTVYTADAVTDDVRLKSMLIVILGLAIPALVACILFRRRVHPTFTLAVAAAALLASGIVVMRSESADRSALPAGNAIAQGTTAADEQIQGSLPLTVRFTGAPGTFRQPESLARVDALANWLRDVYGAHTVGIASTIRAEASNVSGVDTVPPNPVDVDTLLGVTATFDDGAFVSSLLDDDASSTTLRGQLASRSSEEVATLMNRFLTIANAELAGTGIRAEIGTRVAQVDMATELLSDQLLLDAGLTVAMALTLFLLAYVLTSQRTNLDWQGHEDETDEERIARQQAAMAAARADERSWQIPGPKPAARASTAE